MTYVHLLPSSIVCKGANSSCIIDVDKSIYVAVPNSLADVLLNEKHFSLSDYLNKFDSEDKKTFLEYISFLEKYNFILKSNSVLNFKHYDNRQYHSSFKIESIIIDAKNYVDFELKIKTITLVPEVIQVRIFSELDISECISVIQLLVDNNLLNVEFVTNIKKNVSDKDLINIFNNKTFFSRVVVGNRTENVVLIQKKLFCLKELVIDKKQCGQISESLFMPNLRTYLNSTGCNSCLSRKISIDKDGNIKNCPSMAQSFGNIKDTTLEQALAHPDFKKYWNITKDQISVCKDCEFRYICTDCRAYIEDPNDQYSKPLKCGYNPYTNVWEEWSTNPLKQKAIEFYGMHDLVKKDA